MEIPTNESARYRAILLKALAAGSRVLKNKFLSVSVRYKGRVNLVTEADLLSQKAILSVIERLAPLHDYQAEEDAVRDTGSPFRWVIDPLDGTTNYAHGYPASCVSIALLFKDKPILAGIEDPFRGERFIAEKGKGSFLNGKKIMVSGVQSLRESLLITGFAYDRHRHSHFYVERLRKFLLASHDIRRSGSAALDLAWISCGRADGFWEFRLNPWDVAAGWLLVEEAGGRVTDFSGRRWPHPKAFGPQTLASNGRIHSEMLAFFKGLKFPKDLA